jgi:hypothetical protein
MIGGACLWDISNWPNQKAMRHCAIRLRTAHGQSGHAASLWGKKMMRPLVPRATPYAGLVFDLQPAAAAARGAGVLTWNASVVSARA